MTPTSLILALALQAGGVVVIGDSLAAVGSYPPGACGDVAWADAIGEALALPVRNLGAFGATVADVERQQVEPAIADQPAVILISAWGNDFRRARPADEQTWTRDDERRDDAARALMQERLSGAFTRLREALPDARIAIGTYYGMNRTTGPTPWQRKRFPLWIAAVKDEAADYGVEVADTWQEFAGSCCWYLCDNLHPNESGADVIRDTYLAAVER